MSLDTYYHEHLLRAYLAHWLGEQAHALLGDALLQAAHGHGVDVHFLKRLHNPRIERVMGLIRGLTPSTLLDIGSGKGHLLWPLTEQLPQVEVTAIEPNPERAEVLGRVVDAAGLSVALLAEQGQELPCPSSHFDVVTVLEVLEHVPDPEAMAREVVRVAASWVVASVPSIPDTIEDHLRLYDRAGFAALFEDAGAHIVQLTQDRAHFYLLARV